MGGALGCLKDAGVPGADMGGSSPIDPSMQEKINAVTTGYLAELPSTYKSERYNLDWDVWRVRPNAYTDPTYKQSLTWDVSPQADFQALTVKRCTGEEAKGAIEDQIHEAVDGDIDAKLADTPEPGKTASKKAADVAIEKAADACVEQAAKQLTEQLAKNPEMFKTDPPVEGGPQPQPTAKLQRRRR